MNGAVGLGTVLVAFGAAMCANGVFALWRSSPRRRHLATIAEVATHPTFLVLHLDVPTDGGSIRVPARASRSDPRTEKGTEREVVLDGRHKIAWLDAPPRGLRLLAVVSIVLAVPLVIAGAALLRVGLAP